MFPFLHRALVPLLATVTLLFASTGISPAAPAREFEVWLIDQSDAKGQAFGGTIHIYDGNELTSDAAATATPADVLDLSGKTSTLCMASTGANPVRPHMLSFNANHGHAILTFVASGHVVIFNAERRAPVACLLSVPLAGYSTANAPNLPAPDLVHANEVGSHDSHGMVLTSDGGFLWVLDRTQNVAEVFDTGTGARINTIHLNSGAPAGLAPDLADVSPDGTYVFVSLRGPNPLSGDPHASTGSTPGLGVIRVAEGGMNGELEHVVPIHNFDADGVERADTHGIRVRLR